MWSVIDMQQDVDIEHFSGKTYYDLSVDEKISILHTVLPQYVQIYQCVSEDDEIEICLYDTEYKEFITENGYDNQNLFIFWNKCVIPLMNEYVCYKLPSVF